LVKVLVPVYNAASWLPTWLQYAKKWSGATEFVFIENNSSDNTIQIIANSGLPHRLLRVWFKKRPLSTVGFTPFTPMAHVRQLLLSYMRRVGGDCVFVDSDVYIHDPDFIERLAKSKGDIVGGSYTRLFPEGIRLTALFNDRKRYLFVKNGKYDVLAIGMGCAYVHERVLKDRRLDFFPINMLASEDFGYCLKAKKLGYKVILDNTLNIGHELGIGVIKPWLLDSPEFQYSA
jgi:glycosyltransferase involved in cell wall biosynthesis